MVGLSTLAPIMAGGVMLIFAIGVAVWFNWTTPIVERKRSEEGAQDPFERQNSVTTAPAPKLKERLGHMLGRTDKVRLGHDSQTGELLNVAPPPGLSYARPLERERERTG